MDASTAFNAEPYTTFSDIWHFGDVGHRILANRMFAVISPILLERVIGDDTDRRWIEGAFLTFWTLGHDINFPVRRVF